ncbi:MAG TPA: hypothetical protein VD947_04495 [Patescibacteria group bacterium]|nr:hypothetical protein [Patescibacteria group bacterium]
MTTNKADLNKQRNVPQRLSVWALVIAGVLMIPLVTNAPWTASDFIFSAVVLFILVTIYELATKNMSDVKHRAYVAFGVFFTIFLIMGWAASGP